MASWTDVAVRPSAWGMPSSLKRSPNRSRSSARSMASTDVPSTVHARLRQGLGQIDGGLAAELDDDALGPLPLDDVEHVLQRQRLEVEPVGRVEIGADRFGVVVDNDGLVARFPQRPHRMDRAVVELDALPDADGPGAQHQHLGPCAARRRGDAACAPPPWRSRPARPTPLRTSSTCTAPARPARRVAATVRKSGTMPRACAPGANFQLRHVGEPADLPVGDAQPLRLGHQRPRFLGPRAARARAAGAARQPLLHRR